MFKYLNDGDEMNCHVWYLSDHGVSDNLDQQFSINFKWDIPLLDGYSYEFLKNYSRKPGVYNGLFGFINWDILKKLIALPKKSIVVVPGWNSLSYIMALIFGRFLGHKMCMRGDPPLNHELLKGRTSRLLRWMAFKTILFPCVYRFLYVGKQNYDFYRYYGIKNHRLIRAPHAVNNDFFRTEAGRMEGSESSLRNKFHVPIDHKVILYCGKLIEKKNPIDLLRAFSMLPEHIRTTLIFVGEGELRSELEDIIHKENISNVIITGFVNQSVISEYYMIADIFVMCSGTGETWGLSTNEVMNFGVPVILSDLTGCAPDLVDSNGIIFKTNSVSELHQSLLMILELPDIELKLKGVRSKEIVSQYSYDQIRKGIQLI